MVFCIFYGVNENSDVFTATLGSFGIWCLYYYLYWRKKVLKDFGPLWKQYFTIGSLFKSTKTTPNIKKRGGLDFFASGLVFLTLGWIFIDVDDVKSWLFHYYFDEEDLIILIPLLSLISFIIIGLSKKSTGFQCYFTSVSTNFKNTYILDTACIVWSYNV